MMCPKYDCCQCLVHHCGAQWLFRAPHKCFISWQLLSIQDRGVCTCRSMQLDNVLSAHLHPELCLQIARGAAKKLLRLPAVRYLRLVCNCLCSNAKLLQPPGVGSITNGWNLARAKTAVFTSKRKLMPSIMDIWFELRCARPED